MMATNNADFELHRLFNVEGKVAVVTGGGSGIGLMATQALAVNGATVYIVGRTPTKLETVAKIYGEGIRGRIIPLVADIADKEEIRRLVETLQCKERCVHILVNNAGIFSAGQVSVGFGGEEVRSNLFEPDNASFEDWVNVYRTNCASHYFTTTAFLPLLDRASDASPGYTSTVINISSINGLIKESLDHFASNAAKAATIHLTKMLANETAKLGLRIRVNSIAPGVFPSEITSGSSNESQKSILRDDQFPLTKTISAGRPGNDMDMASAVLFAATNQYINGQIISVDGGYLVKYGTL